MIKPEDIYTRTNNGLDIVLYYYPQAQKAIEKKEPFKIRDEKTPSASIKQIKGVWKVTDFGDDGVSRSPIDVVMFEENCTFAEAICKLADRYGIESGLNAEINKPIFEHRTATEEEKEGEFKFEVKESFSDFELNVWGPKVKNEHLEKYKYFSLKWYSRTKDHKTTVIKSTENYPIFMRDCGAFKKIYQPLNVDKSKRFFYVGSKPAEYINGLEELEKSYAEFENQQFEEFEQRKESGSGKDNEKFKPKKLDECIICSGERDAINIASYGYFPLWFNSETYRLSESEFKKISRCVLKVYNIPDIDSTGIRKGIELAMKFMDIYTVWLPEWLPTYKDMRGKPRKDLRDFVELRPKIQDLNNLIRVAMPMRFWEQKVTKEGLRWEINSAFVHHFLKCNGFGTLENKSSKTGSMYISITNNIVKEIKAKHIRAFLRQFLEERYVDLEITNLVLNTTRLSESSLENLKEKKIDFTDYGRNFQFLFFQNKVWEVTGNEIKEQKYNSIDRFVWDEKVLKHNVKRTSDSFKVLFTEENDVKDIQIDHLNSNFFKYLINTSRIHWRKEFEERIESFEGGITEYKKKHHFDIAGPLLNEEEIFEQKIHLVNKIFALGYLLHRYKFKDRAWCVTSIDGKINSDNESNGRSGKSFYMGSIAMFKKITYISGRNPKVADNPHIFERVNEYTEFVWCDDAYDYFPFNILFDKVTNDFEVNPKNNSSFVIPFSQAPKLGITTNYMIRQNDGSTLGRLLYTVFSDYYHVKTDSNGYKETVQISDDFNGKILFDELYSEEEWNHDINFFADCLKFYLSTIGMLSSSNSVIKIEPIMKNVTDRRLHAIMGENFRSWASVYFHPDSENVDNFIKRIDAFNAYCEHINNRKITPQTFMDKLKAFCVTSNYVIALNPAPFLNSEDRIVKKVEGKTYEMLYLQTKPELDSWLTEKPLPDDKKPF